MANFLICPFGLVRSRLRHISIDNSSFSSHPRIFLIFFAYFLVWASRMLHSSRMCCLVSMSFPQNLHIGSCTIPYLYLISLLYMKPVLHLEKVISTLRIIGEFSTALKIPLFSRLGLVLFRVPTILLCRFALAWPTTQFKLSSRDSCNAKSALVDCMSPDIPLAALDTILSSLVLFLLVRRWY